MVNAALAELDGEFAAMYAPMGRPSIPPEKLLRGSLLQAFYTIRSERQLMERLNYDLLFRWFVGLGIDDEVWDHSVFSKNRDRLLEAEISGKFLAAILTQPEIQRLLSDDHFSVDGTLVQAWASLKSFKPRSGGEQPPPADGGRNEDIDFRGEKRSNRTHAATTDPDAMLYRKGRCAADQGLGPCRKTGRARYDRTICRQTEGNHARWRQGLRCGGLRHGTA